MAEQPNANQKLKAMRVKFLATSIVLALAFHGLAFMFMPSIKKRPYVPRRKTSIAVENVKTEDYDIPPPPEEEEIKIDDVQKQVEIKVTGTGPKIKSTDIADVGKKNVADLNKPVEKKKTVVPKKHKVIGFSQMKARIIKRVKPRFPAAAAKMGFEGTTVMIIYVNTKGKVGRVQIIKPSGNSACDAAALSAARGFVFRPLLVNGKPYPVKFSYTVKWKMSK